MTEITQIANRIAEKKEEKLIYGVRSVERLSPYSPNILAVVNFPDNPNGVITRGYIFDICFEEAYGTLERAVEHFVKKSAKLQGFVVHDNGNGSRSETREPLLCLMGFLKGKDWRKKGIDGIDRDIIYFPFEKSDEKGRATANPFLVKSSIHEDIGTGSISTINPNEMEDLYPLLTVERMRRLTLSPEKFKEFPDLSSLGIKYV
ncbi:MAG: hypothetical protein AABW63_02195 [Nanoarchaeota archaeon]